MQVTIYHNPRCSKSRATLKLLEENGITPDVVEYLSGSLDIPTIKLILKWLKFSSPHQLLRVNEAEFALNNLSDKSLSEDQVIAVMVENPILIERPIVVVDNKIAVIGRPPENILAIIT